MLKSTFRNFEKFARGVRDAARGNPDLLDQWLVANDLEATQAAEQRDIGRLAMIRETYIRLAGFQPILCN